MFQGQTAQRFDVIAAQDGLGNHTTILDAVLVAPAFSKLRYHIKIKYIVVKAPQTNLLALIGDEKIAFFQTGK